MVALEPGDLTHKLAVAGPPPAALEVDPPVPRARGCRDAPAFRPIDAGQQLARVATEPPRDERIHAVEETGHVGRAHRFVGPVRAEREVAHSRSPRDVGETVVADPRPHRRRRRVVRDVDHGIQQLLALRAERFVVRCQRPEVGDEQHRLRDARRDVRAVGVQAVLAPGRVDDRERVVAGTVLEVATRSDHRPHARVAVGGPIGRGHVVRRGPRHGGLGPRQGRLIVTQ